MAMASIMAARGRQRQAKLSAAMLVYLVSSKRLHRETLSWKKQKSVGVFVHIFPYIATLPGDLDIDVISSLQLAQYIQ